MRREKAVNESDEMMNRLGRKRKKFCCVGIVKRKEVLGQRSILNSERHDSKRL